MQLVQGSLHDLRVSEHEDQLQVAKHVHHEVNQVQPGSSFEASPFQAEDAAVAKLLLPSQFCNFLFLLRLFIVLREHAFQIGTTFGLLPG